MHTQLVALALVTGAVTADRFADFKVKYVRKYESAAEESRRRAVFEANMGEAARLQALNPLATFGENDFADKTKAELAHLRMLKTPTAEHIAKIPVAKVSRVAAPKSVNWVTQGAVTGVKNQGQCGDCWAFSCTGGIEGAWKLAGNTLTSVSEQELTSCAHGDDDGCNGGLMGDGYAWLVNNRKGAIDTEASYPFTSSDGQSGQCTTIGHTVGSTITGYNLVQKGDMTAWVAANGPLPIGADAVTWQTYTGGIMTNCANGHMDHGILIAGFDDAHSPPYWLIKNSWSVAWGEEGYIRVSKATQLCSIGGYQVAPTVAKNNTKSTQ